jgi:hypothetical protein
MDKFKIGDKVKWIDGMGFETHGIIVDCVSEEQIKVLTRDGVLRINHSILGLE